MTIVRHSISFATISILTAFEALLLISCTQNSGDSKKTTAKVNAEANQKSNSSDIVAGVDGVNITREQVVEIMNSVDGGLSAKEAVEILVRNELLAQEAKRRGFDSNQEVTDAEKIALVRALLRTHIDKGVTVDKVDLNRLRAFYEANKDRFVHGVMRRVQHILVFAGKNGLPEEEAAIVASQIAQEAERISTEEEFVELYKSVKNTYKKIKLESLAPFTAKDKRYVPAFIKAAFEVPIVGMASPPIKTQFGWHVIFVAEELKPENRSFDEVKDELAEKMLPSEKSFKLRELIGKLQEKEGVFVYRDVPLAENTAP